MVWVSSCASSSAPSGSCGRYWLRPKKMCLPYAKARAARRVERRAASSSVWIRTAPKSASKRGSMKRRTSSDSGAPDVRLRWMSCNTSSLTAGSPVASRSRRRSGCRRRDRVVSPGGHTRAADMPITVFAVALASRSAGSSGEETRTDARCGHRMLGRGLAGSADKSMRATCDRSRTRRGGATLGAGGVGSRRAKTLRGAAAALVTGAPQRPTARRPHAVTAGATDTPLHSCGTRAPARHTGARRR